MALTDADLRRLLALGADHHQIAEAAGIGVDQVRRRLADVRRAPATRPVRTPVTCA